MRPVQAARERAVTPIAFARAIAAAYRQRDRSPAAALKQAQITPVQLQRADARISARQLEALSAAAMQELDDEGLGAYERRLPWGSYGMLARASLTAPTLGVALKRWCRHHGLLTQQLRIELAVAGGSAVVRLHDARVLPPELHELNVAFLLRNVHGLACWYVDSRIPLEGAAFPFPAPAHADAYGYMFPCALEFSAPQAGIRFPASYLGLPLRRDEKAMAAMLQRALPVTVLQYRKDRLLAQQVRQALLAQTARSHTAEGLAQALHVSVRTLHRQLKEEGTSLQALKDEVRCERAQELLWRSARPVKQVAAAVGFGNEKSFTRAFRQWTGLTPGEFRQAGGSRENPPTGSQGEQRA